MDYRRKRLQKNKRQKSNQSEKEYKEKQKHDWSNMDKQRLLEALKKHGAENINAISEMLPHVSSENITLKIQEYSNLANNSPENESLCKWLDSGIYEPGDSLIPEALLFILLFEDHPSPIEAAGYDFRAIYDFLYRSCLEETSSDLSGKDLNLLCSFLSTIENRVWPKHERDILAYVGRTCGKMKVKKVYPGKTTHSSLH
ncbi:uncharacterized protein LOC143260497 [Megalopta genalis]|uniref:uncharacterized protein LOC143260497 n=1 Tax=Megalopta genalis TaxID=115081 RepID=UPI003FD19AE9